MFGYTLRDYQQAAIDATWGFLCHRQGNPVIVAPTGSGKSLLAAELARGAIENGRKVLILAHRKELLVQNRDKVRALLPNASVGLYSAGLGKRETEQDVILAGIQSVHEKAFEFGERHLAIADEAHLIADKSTGMYRTFLGDLRVSCPGYRLVGLTATPYRLDSGLIYGGNQMFDDVSHQIEVAQLIEQGHLCSVTTKAVTEVDTSGLRHRGGEFVRHDMENLFDKHVVAACEETVSIANSSNRKSVLLFCTGVQHAEHVKECIERLTGENVALVTGETLPIMRETFLDQFRSGSLRWLVNVDVLTTGFDAPCVDCLAVMRATESAGLFAQIVGRGLRLHPGKSECLVLDFGGNIKRHGPIDAKDYGKREKPKGSGGDAPEKLCPACGELVAAGRRECACGWVFPPPEINHDGTADKSAILESQQEPQEWIVEGVSVGVHFKRRAPEGTPRTFRVNYECLPADSEGGNLERELISEWVCIEHEDFARRKAENWWRDRSAIECPYNAEEAVELFHQGALADTTRITTLKEGKFYRVTKHVLGEVPTTLAPVNEEVPF